jgi:pimeloyl-ACP methyl ester carboxylesterase
LNWAWLSTQALRELGEATAEELAAIDALRRHSRDDSGYSKQQATRPQTLGYGLADSPVGQCAWIVEKLQRWSDCDGHPENAFTRDEILDNVSLYWLTNSATSSARLYWESVRAVRDDVGVVDVPAAYSAFPHEIACYTRRWVATRYSDLRHYRRLPRGGHFAACEHPELFADEVRDGARALQGRS